LFLTTKKGNREELHDGKGARSQTGAYSDVKVITPDREIPWNEVSHFSDEEMKRLMKEVVNRLYTLLLHFDDKEFLNALLRWGTDTPKNGTSRKSWPILCCVIESLPNRKSLPAR
jgi:hypothetical protein